MTEMTQSGKGMVPCKKKNTTNMQIINFLNINLYFREKWLCSS